jgi:hypothetical protein
MTYNFKEDFENVLKEKKAKDLCSDIDSKTVSEDELNQIIIHLDKRMEINSPRETVGISAARS